MRMKPGDLVLVVGTETGLVLTEPRISEDCLPGGEAHPNEMYHIVTVLGQHGIEDWAEDDLELVSEDR